MTLPSPSLPPGRPRRQGERGPAVSAAPAGEPLNPAGDRLLLIVAGSSIAAEMRDRPLAYRLRERVLVWLDARESSEGGSGAVDSHVNAGASAKAFQPMLLQPVVCSDLWYLNDRELDDRPAIAIGDPSSNAATAMFSSRLPTAFLIEQAFRVHLDPEFVERRAAIWGVNTAATASAIDLFVERYLNDFLLAAMDG
jgi:hypothetical protein